jgi:hypothetical protein
MTTQLVGGTCGASRLSNPEPVSGALPFAFLRSKLKARPQPLLVTLGILAF